MPSQATPPIAAEPELLTISEAAQRLRVHRATIYRFIAAGTLSPVLVGSRKRLRRQELERLERGESVA